MIHYTILDKKRQDIVPLLSAFKDDFYLAGGTGLALQIGHRDSIDFDFFSEKDFDTAALFQKAEHVFSGKSILKTQEEKGTLSLIIDGYLKISFFYYPYQVLEPFLEEPHIRIASISDIGVMKLSAIVSRSTFKDYVDIFYILKHIPLSKLLEYTHTKTPNLDQNLVLKSLVYFKDVTLEKIVFKGPFEVTWPRVQEQLIKEVKNVV